MKKVLSFGELLLRISPAGDEDIAENPMELYVGGAEANVATALAGWEVPVKYSTVLPDNFMSRHVRQYLESRGIDTTSVVMGGNRIGVYYLDSGSDLKGNVVYDRDYSSFSQLKRGVLDWDKIFTNVTWFNFSAISPALNQNVADVCLEALEAASRKKITISVDLNYRSRLWQYGQQPIDVMPGLVKYCDVVMGNIWSAHTMLGTHLDEQISEKNSKQAYLEHAEATSKEILKKFPQCQVVANTFRFDNPASDLLYYTTLYRKDQFFVSPEFRTKGAVDRSGSGDCFMAGLIYGFYNHHASQKLLDFATAAAFGKLQEMGDATGQDKLTVARIREKKK